MRGTGHGRSGRLNTAPNVPRRSCSPLFGHGLHHSERLVALSIKRPRLRILEQQAEAYVRVVHGWHLRSKCFIELGHSMPVKAP